MVLMPVFQIVQVILKQRRLMSDVAVRLDLIRLVTDYLSETLYSLR